MSEYTIFTPQLPKRTKMKYFSTLFLILLFPVIITAQSLTPQVISSAGDFYQGSNVSLSWTLGEIATETYDNGNIVLTQGFQQPFGISIQGIDLAVLVYMEGPFNGGSMNTTLKDNGQIPLNQPYNVSPWFYAGSESVASIPPNAVDWILVDLRDATSASAALPSTSVEMKAAFILSNGSVVDLDGSSVLQFSASINNAPYVVVWHRNHLGVLSATSPVESGGIYSYDFSTSVNSAYGGGLGYKLIDTGVYGMAGGDANGDGAIDGNDKAIWATNAGTTGYQQSDFNMDDQVNNQDKNSTWVENGSLNSQVPQ